MKISETAKQHEHPKPTENFSPIYNLYYGSPESPKNGTRKGRKRLQVHQTHSLSQGLAVPLKYLPVQQLCPPLSRPVQLKNTHPGIIMSSLRRNSLPTHTSPALHPRGHGLRWDLCSIFLCNETKQNQNKQ